MAFLSAVQKAGVALLSLIIVSACSDGSDRQPGDRDDYLPISTPLIEDPPSMGDTFLNVARYDLADLGYTQSEFFLSGAASAFTNINELQSDGLWQVQPGETANYKTRIVVLRPIDSANFSGTVFVEWLHTGASFDQAPAWLSGHVAIAREGHAWIGVSAEIAGVRALNTVDPDRYGSLAHPGDSFSYDIYSQASEAVRSSSDTDILGGMLARDIVGLGYARSSTMMVTFINAIHPLYNPYDGYLLSRRGGTSRPLSQPPQELIETPEAALIRADLNVPVMTVQSETELFTLGFLDARQEDTEKFRLWEVAGTSHVDPYTFLGGLDDAGTDPRFAVVTENNFNCDSPVNSGLYQWVFNTAVGSMADWVSNALAPLEADRLAITSDSTSLVYDTLGNVLGGIRTPYVDSPAAVISGEGQSGSGSCYLWGKTQLFDADYMASLYVDQAGYIQAVSDATDDAVAKGFLLTPDAERIKDAAALQWDMLGN
jgi:Alpha/beta hydrolase domain